MDNLTIVIPYWNGQATIGRLLDSLPSGLPVIVVDDHSDVPLAPGPRYRLLRPDAKGYFTGACNVALGACDTDVLILNQDAEMQGTAWLDMLAKQRKTYAMIGERIKGTHPAWVNGYIHGTFTYLRRDAIRAVGLMNAADYPLWGSTCEYQVRLCRKGYKVLPLAQVPGLVHDRPGKFGGAISEALHREKAKRDLFIRTPPMISVIVPCYNYGRYLADCVHSLIGGTTSLGEMPGQTFQSFEVIIVDDASTDDTAKRAGALADAWQGVRYLRLGQNSGTAAAINAGVRASFGRYVTVLSADDMAEAWHLDSLLRTCQANPHGVAYGDLALFKRGQRFDVFRLPAYDFEQTLYKNGMAAGIMYPRQAWQEVGGYPEVMHDGREDWAFNVGLGIHGWCGVKVEPAQGPGYLCRREGHNRSLRNAGPGWRNTFMAKMMALYPSVYQGERPMGCCGCGRRAAKPAAKGAGGAPKKSTGYQLPGRDGLALLEYVGTNYGTSTWFGPVTGTRYEFGLAEGSNIKYVDARDAPDLLKVTEGTKTKRLIFRKYVAPKKQEPPPDPAPAPTPTPAAAPAEPAPVPVNLDYVEVLAADDLTAIPGIGQATAKKLRGLGFATARQVADYSADDLAGMAGIPLARATKIIEAARALA